MTYYIKPGGGSGDGQSIATAWSFGHFNSTGRSSVVAGDTVLFENGAVYAGGITLQNNGSSGSPITFGTYGAGAKARITGLVTINPTTDAGGQVRYAPLTGIPSLTVATVDDEIKPMGRYPRFSWLQINSHSGQLQITDNDLPNVPSFVGAELVRRDQRYLVNRYTVTSQNNGVINMSNTSWAMGSTGGSLPADLNGYFFQNLRACIDTNVHSDVQFGDWYYDLAGGGFYMYFGSELPANHVVKVSNTQIVVNLTNKSWYVFNDLIFEGGNLYTMYGVNANHIKFNRCEWRNSGGFAGHISESTYIDLQDCEVNNCEADTLALLCDNCTIDNFKVNGVSMEVGMGNNGDGTGNGFVIIGDGNTLTNIRVKDAGYNGIEYDGNNFLLDGFDINSFCNNKDDGAGLYIYDSQLVNRVIRNGVIRNGKNCFPGGESDSSVPYGKAYGVYFDDLVENVDIRHVYVENCSGGGVFVHGAKNLEIHYNTFFNNRVQAYYNEWLPNLITNVNRSHNTYISNPGQITEYFHVFQAYTDFATYGTSDHNIYSTPHDVNADKFLLLYDQMESQIEMSLAEWQADSGRDLNSVQSTVGVSGPDDFRIDVNDTAAPKSISIAGADYRDAAGTIYSPPGYTLAPFSGKTLMYYQENETTYAPGARYTIDGKYAVNEEGKYYTVAIPT